MEIKKQGGFELNAGPSHISNDEGKARDNLASSNEKFTQIYSPQYTLRFICEACIAYVSQAYITRP